MQVVFDSRTLPAAKRGEAWRQAFCEIYLPVSCAADLDSGVSPGRSSRNSMSSPCILTREKPLACATLMVSSATCGRKSMATVVQALARSKYVVTVRGRNGGLRIARPADDILVAPSSRSSH